ncbi:MAG: NADH-quinone oxidoreductase subunit J [Gammaproteobacteria bacterium]|nr:NADH-quinone oxidoreductase subunit J [Gammaproteobacteria bacterium]
MDLALFWIPAAVALVSTFLVITRRNAAHALIYLVVSLLSVAVIFFVLGAPFAAALEVVIYAGAIVVLFLFVVMMLNLGNTSVMRESRWLRPGMWVGPAILVSILLVTMVFLLSGLPDPGNTKGDMVGPKAVGNELFRPYLLAVELAGFLLLAALIGAYHLGRRYLEQRREP